MAATTLDTHLLLNALNFFSMDLYRRTGAESPVMGHLADYIMGEHGLSANTQLQDGQPAGVAWEHELRLCQSQLQLQAAMGGFVANISASAHNEMILVPPRSISSFIHSFVDALRNFRGQTLQFDVACERAPLLLITLSCSREQETVEAPPGNKSALESALDHARAKYAGGGLKSLELVVQKMEPKCWEVLFRENRAS